MNEIDLLIADARKIAAFGMRAGLLGDTALYAALAKVDAVKAAGTLAWGDPALAELQKATDEAAQKLLPVTLVDLNAGFDPFAAPPPPGASLPQRIGAMLSRGKLQAACLVATLILVFAAGYYTLWHARATELMRFTLGDSISEQETVVRRMLLPLLVTMTPAPVPAEPPATRAGAEAEAIADAKVMEAAAGAPESPANATDSAATPAVKTGAEAARLGLLLETTAEIEKLQRAIARFDERFKALYQDRIIGWGQWSDLLDYREDRKEEAKERARREALAKAGEPAASPQSEYDARIKQLQTSCTEEREAAVVQAFLGDTGGGIRRTAEALVNADALRHCFLDALGMSPLTIEALESEEMEKKLFEFEHALNIVGNWLLPAIYGALGALVYYMRQFVNPLRPDPTASRVAMRVALGALAGILLAWFWTTTTVEEGLTVPDVGLGTLAFAFLLGFSIEVFFGLLDRFVQLANQSIQRIGTAG
jgi:hypothetical protein